MEGYLIMFGPNTYFQGSVDICYSHRDKQFFDLFHNTKELFAEKFGLHDYDVLFVPGSGTVGIEALLFSLKLPVRMIGHDGVFTRRWAEMNKTHPKKADVHTHTHTHAHAHDMFCLFETSCSGYFSQEGCLVDAISGFPYYDIPQNTRAFVTCLNKQIGTYVGLSVVCVRKNFWDNLIGDDVMSYLNLARYRRYHEIDQTPSTSPTYIYQNLFERLKTFDLAALRYKIDTVSDIVTDAVGAENVIGEIRAPAITIKENVIPPELAKEYELYGVWTGKRNLQVFTYSEPIEHYERVFGEIKARMRG